MFFFLLFFSLQIFAGEVYCPLLPDSPMVADPAIVETKDKILVMGTGDILSWSSTEDLLKQRPPQKENFDLYQEVLIKNEIKSVPLRPHEVPWDLQLYEFQGKKFLYGGLMTPRTGETNAEWPKDNISRRIKVAEFDENLNGWVFRQMPLFGSIDHGSWKGHAYGQQIISDRGIRYVFHEEISEEGITEIFLRPLKSPYEAGNPIKVVGVRDLENSATKRIGGGHLLEGPRYQKLSLSGKTVHLIYFSTGDFPTSNYATRLAYSFDDITGPYKIFRSSTGDAVDLTRNISEAKGLYGTGRAFPFSSGTRHMLLFHGAKRLPGTNHALWPETLNNFRRCLFVAEVQFKLSANHDLEVQIKED